MMPMASSAFAKTPRRPRAAFCTARIVVSILIGAVGALTFAELARADWQGAAGISGANYANVPGTASGRIDAQASWQSEARVDQGQFAKDELQVMGFYETGP